MAIVVFPSAQRRWVDGVAQIEIDANRIVDLIAALSERFPELAGKLDGAAVSLDGVIHNDARYQPLTSDTEVIFVGAIAGGSGERAAQGAARVPSPDAGDPLGLAARWRSEGRAVALATVVATWGSSPNPAGSQLAVDDTGHFEGSVSGGCVEGAVIEAAAGVLESGQPRLLEFGVADEEAWAVGLACGGRVAVFVERVD